jgi:transitional endoplasmic reticulum ATPase
MAERERALSEDELLFAGVAGSDLVAETATRGRPSREIYLRIAESLPGDVDKGYVRLHLAALEALGLSPGALVAIEGKRSFVVRAEAAPTGLPGDQVVRMDGTLRDNAMAGIDDRVRVRPGSAIGGFSLVIVPDERGSLSDEDLTRLRQQLQGRVLSAGDKVNITCLPRGELICKIVETQPTGPIVIAPDTVIHTRVTTVKSQKPPIAS